MPFFTGFKQLKSKSKTKGDLVMLVSNYKNQANFCANKKMQVHDVHRQQYNYPRNFNNSQTNNLVNFKGSKFKIIDLNTWDRVNIFKTFQKFQDPYNHMNVRMDLTNLLKYCKENTIKGSHAIIHLISKSLNAIPQYRTRLLTDGTIVEYEKINPVFSIAVGPGKPFSSASVEYDANPKIHLQSIADKIAEVKKTNGGDSPAQHYIDQDNFHLSCIKGLDFTSTKCGIVTPQDSKPLVSWGMYSPEETVTLVNGQVTSVNKIKSTFFLRTHHGFADGDHITEFYKSLQKYFNSPEEVLGGQTKH